MRMTRTSALAIALAAARAAAQSPMTYGAGRAPGLEWFGDAKFGLFMHWGPVTQWGAEISFPLVCPAFPCTVQGPGKAPVTIENATALAAHRAAYAALASTFSPDAFDPPALARAAREAGFRYMVYTTIHCDGFANWPSNVTAYNSVAGAPLLRRDVFGELAAAFRAEGLRVGAYVCPSLWNSDLYWQPDALTALGSACTPNYDPGASATDAARWDEYLSTTLHALIGELAARYAPDLFWLDCSNAPPRTDTRVEALVGAIRAANPEALVMTRGGVFSDYVELDDQQEAQAAAILGAEQMDAGTRFEVCGVLQSTTQWAFDPTSGQKPAAEVVRNLATIVAKGGNYLLNVAPDASGVWPDSARAVLSDLAAWFAAGGGEALHYTIPVYPFSDGGGAVLFTARSARDAAAAGARALYAILPTPNATTAGGDAELTLVPLRPAVLDAPPVRVELLQSTDFPAGEVTAWSLRDEGLAINYTIPQLPANLTPGHQPPNALALVFRIQFPL